MLRFRAAQYAARRGWALPLLPTRMMCTSRKNKLHVAYGSQSGTAMSFAGLLTKEAKARRFQPRLSDLETVTMHDLEPATPLVLIMATHGEGEPTDNAADFYEWLMGDATRDDVEGLKYAVFGLGNSTTYPHRYNVVGKAVHARLEALGAEAIIPLGLGDDSRGHSIDDDFEDWKEQLWEVLHDIKRDGGSETVEAAPTGVRIVTHGHEAPCVEEHRTSPRKSSEAGLPDYKSAARVRCVVNRELHTSLSGRSARHIELDLNDTHVEGSRISGPPERPSLHYITGDHLGVLPENNDNEVDEFLSMNALDGATVISVPASEGPQYSSLFAPQTTRRVLKRHKDLNGAPSRGLLQALAQFAGDSAQRMELESWADRGQSHYEDIVLGNYVNIVDILRCFPSLQERIPLSIWLELLPGMQARFYSISSCEQPHPSELNRAALTVSVLRAPVPSTEIKKSGFKGLCSNFLAGLQPDRGDQVTCFVRHSQMRLPPDPLTPIIMIGAGAGIAPLRAFVHERRKLIENGESVGPALLYFGCEHPDKDFIYREEMEEALGCGALSGLHPSFAQQPDEQGAVYPQEKLLQSGAQVHDLIIDGAYTYVCGKGSTVGQGVRTALQQIFMDYGHCDEGQSYTHVEELQSRQRLQQDVFA